MTIITFLVYDSFDGDLEAVTVYKRIQNLHNQQDLYVPWLHGQLVQENQQGPYYICGYMHLFGKFTSYS